MTVGFCLRGFSFSNILDLISVYLTDKSFSFSILQIWNGNSYMLDQLKMRHMISYLKVCLLVLLTLGTTVLFSR